jgi:hypothetical protein
MKRALAFQWRRAFFLHAESETAEGVWILWEPCLRLPVEARDADLGEAALAAARGSRRGVPHPRSAEWKSVVAPLLEFARAASYRGFANGATGALLRSGPHGLSLLPMRNLGPGEGFVAEEGGEIPLPSSAGSGEVGAALWRILRIARRSGVRACGRDAAGDPGLRPRRRRRG